MTIEISKCVQGESEWFSVRMGIPTASEFSTVMASGKGGGESKTRRTYLNKLAGERHTGQPAESYSNKFMERGKAMEPEARNHYSMITDNAPEQVGFIKSANKGCSPDSLIGGDGMLEIKTMAPHLLIEVLKADKVPDEHVAQLQGNLWVAERQWIDLMIYWPGMPTLLKRVPRDEAYISSMAKAVDEFNAELDAVVAWLRAR